MYTFPHSVTSEDIYKTIYNTETTAHAFREAAHYRYMNNWSEKYIDMDYLTYQWPTDWRIPSVRTYNRDAYLAELPDSPCYELMPDSEKASGGYYINTLAHAKANIQLINAPADYVPLGKSEQGQLFINANYDSPYHGIVVFVNNDYTYQAIVAHNPETFSEFWIESIVTGINGGSVADTCKAMWRDGPVWEFVSPSDGATSSKIVQSHSLRWNIMEQLHIMDLDEDARIIVEDVGCYYSVGVIERDRVERAAALFHKATGKCIIQGLGYLPDFPILTWEKSFIQLMHIIRQEETKETQILSLANLREHAFRDESILGELDTYCGTNVSRDLTEYTTLEQRQKRTIVAYCDGCGRGLCGMVGIWYTCNECENYDLCLTCYSYLHMAECKKCRTHTGFVKHHVVNGERCSCP